ncbi:alpha/beta fold hydrolase [Roseovarius sp. D0-M9]|uniref:alpha/beta fold hydrolase n=1 Tax=Roseovarius sp. D0-M9 TaxID=3127117 RepID=UPI00300FA442
MTWTTQPRSEAGQLSAITAGDGQTVLLIHGVGLRAEAWGAQIAALAGFCRVQAVDMPGHGQSAALSSGAQLADFTDVIAAAINGPAVVIGHSFGAMIALDIAIRHPGKVKAVAALNAVHRRSAAAKAAVMRRAAMLDGVSAADPTATLDRWFGPVPSPEREACREWLCAVDPARYRDAYRVFAAEDGPSDEGLHSLGCPALFLTGADEPNSTPAMSRRMAALAPQGRAKIIPGAAHMLPMTHAAEVSAILEHFVKGHSE